MEAGRSLTPIFSDTHFFCRINAILTSEYLEELSDKFLKRKDTTLTLLAQDAISLLEVKYGPIYPSAYEVLNKHVMDVLSNYIAFTVRKNYLTSLCDHI